MSLRSNRIEWIDLCKAIGIFLVVFAHVDTTVVSSVYIFGFHMPLFFFLSGVVFNYEKYTVKSFIKSRFNGLIIPYVFFYLITYVYWLFIERNVRPLDMTWWQPLIGLFQGTGHYTAHNGILWFLPCLFVVELIFFLICEITDKNILRVAAILILTLVGFGFDKMLPWSTNVAMTSLQFFAVGFGLKNVLVNKPFSKIAAILLFVFGLCYFTIQGLTQNKIGLVTANYGNKCVFEISSYLGIMMILMFSMLLKNNALVNKWGGVIGSNTIVIFGIHGPLLRVLRYLFQLLFPAIQLESNILCSLIVSIICIVILYPFIPLYNIIKKRFLSKCYIC